MNKLRLLIDVFAILMAFWIVGFAISDAADDYKVTKELFKPLLVGIQAVPSEVKLEGWDLVGGYHVNTMRYENVTVTIRNVGTTEVSARVNVQLFNVNNTVIASGEKQANIYANTTFHVNVPLQWTENKTIVDYAGGLVTVS